MFYDLHYSNLPIKKNREITFNDLYGMWFDDLLERAMRLFVWSGTDNVPPKEIEQILLINGVGGVTDKYNSELSIFFGELAGEPTQYYDEKKSFSLHSPVYSAVLNIGTDVVLIDNCATRDSAMSLFIRYATLLAHTELSIIGGLVNSRDSGGTPIASTQAQAESIINYRKKLVQGDVYPILDPALMGVEFLSTDKKTMLSVVDLMDTRQKLLDGFYNDLGVKTSYNKRGNMIVEEVEANNSMLTLNISDMLDSRRRCAELVNKRFGTNWQVEKAKEIQYSEKGADVDVV